MVRELLVVVAMLHLNITAYITSTVTHTSPRLLLYNIRGSFLFFGDIIKMK
jgi:hypothetical protein